MHIGHLDLYHVSLPLTEVWKTGCGDESAIQSVIVRMVVDGVDGWAETAPHRGPLYSPEWADGVFSLIRDWLGPMVVGQTARTGAELQSLLSTVRGNPFAKAALDVAWWDAFARHRSEPVWRVIGGHTQDVEVGADLGVKDRIDELLEAIGTAVDAGFKRVKLKYRPGWDLFMLEAVRARFPDQAFHIDCNSGYTLDDVPMFKEIDRFNLAMIEQPLAYDDLVDHAKLQDQIETPICLDETINSLDRARHAIELGSCRWINIKVGRTGGLTPALAIHDLCQEHGILNWIGGMLESALGQSPSLALATLPNAKYPADVFPSARFYAQDLCDPPLELSGPSKVRAPDRPGLGWIPDPERLARHTLKHASVH